MVDVRTTNGSARGSGVAAAPLFLLGPARSGTSLLYKLLCLHPEAAYISNYVARFPSLPRLAALNRLAPMMPDRRRRVWFGAEGSNAYVYGGRRSPLDRAFPMPVEGEPVFRRAGLPATSMPAPARAQATARRVARAVTAVRRASGASVFVNKRIANIYRTPLLARALPEARFVAQVRDGRAVALSLSKVDWWPTSTVVGYGGTPERWAAEGGDPWELCARNWVDELAAMEHGLAQVPAERILRLRYEDLIAEPMAMLETIAAFAGLPPSAPWHEAVEALSFPDRNDAWRRALSPGALATIDGIQAETLARYGYER
jgi:hypothetical protein